MATCPNINLESWENLVIARGEDTAYYLWDVYNGNVPESESKSEIVKSGLKSVNILRSPKADQFFASVEKNKISGDFFWKKMQADLSIPKDQVELLKSFNTTDRNELVTNMLANYSYAIEINVAGTGKAYLEGNPFSQATTSYSNLTVPGGTNYTENEIATPAITPFIKGHAQFATDKGIGWFRSDDKSIGEIRIENPDSIFQDEIYEGSPTKTRRILEVQSDLFQRGRDKKIIASKFENNPLLNELGGVEKVPLEGKENQFLQLLNKGNNWVTFFVKSIIQDSAKKGYEKVLFPSGSTVYKIESGGRTIEDYIKNKENRLAELEEQKKEAIIPFEELEDWQKKVVKEEGGNFFKNNRSPEIIDNEINQVKKEIKDAKEGLSGLAATARFYEETVNNVLNKQYGKENVKQVTDEYGNTWNEIEIVPEREQQPILLQKKGTETSAASPQTISMIKDFLKRIGVDIKPMQQIVVNGVKQDANGAALIMQKLVQVVEGKEASALPEEAMHFAVEIIKQTNPALYKKLLKEINGYRIYSQVAAEYSRNPLYQTKDGKPDVLKLKDEAIAKVLADVITKKVEGSIEKPENLQKALSWWEQIIDWLRGLFSKSGFDQAAMEIISGKKIGTADDIRAAQNAAYLQQKNSAQTDIINKLKDVRSRIEKRKVMEDGEEVEKYFIDGKQIRRRVTDLSKDWYSRLQSQNDLTKSDYKIALDDLRKEKGTAGHKYFEYAFKMFVDEDGYLRDTPLDENVALAQIPSEDRAVFGILKDNLLERLRTIDAENNGGVRFMTEVTIYDPSRSIAGTVDLLAVAEDGKTYILDWKFISPQKTEKGDDIPWYNVNSWRIQMEQYKLIMRSVYGVKPENFKQTRMIPIQAIYTGGDPRTNVLPTLSEVKIGDVTVKNIQEDFLMPLSLADETTGKKELDTLLEKLNAVYKKFAERRVLPSEKLDKNTQLNSLFQAIRHLQMKQNLRPLLRQAKILNLQIEKLIDRYNNEFKGKEATSFTDKQLSEFSADLITAQESLRTYTSLDVDLAFLFEEELIEKDEELMKDLENTATAARTLMKKLEGEHGVINEFASEIIAKSEKVNSILSAEKVIKGFTKYFGTTSTLQTKAIQLLYKKANKAFAFSGMETMNENQRLLGLKQAYDKWARGKGLSAKNYFNLIKKKGKNELIDEFNPEFFSTLKKKIEAKDFDWIRQNINVEEYNKALAEELQEEIQRILNKPRLFDNPQDAERMQRFMQSQNPADLPNEVMFEINQARALRNTSTTESPGWLLYDSLKKHPAEKWVSKEWKELHDPKNKPALDFYNYIKEKNEEYRDLGYISKANARVFLPFVRKTLTEKLVLGGKVRLGEQFFRSISVDEGDVGLGQIDPLTGKPIDVIPKYFTSAIEGEVSEDLFRTMAFYNEAAIRYKYLKQMEDQLRLISGVEGSKKAIATSMFGKTEYKDGVLQYNPNNNENSKLYDDMMKSIIYGQKFLTSETFDQLLGKLGTWGETLNKKLGVNIFPEGLSERQLSVNKLLNNLNNTFQISALGLNLLSASSNFFGGNAQSIINSGKYFTKGDYLASELEIFTQRLNVPNQKKIIAALEYFLPLTENYNREFAKKLALNSLTQESLQDALMILMRKSDLNVQTANFLSFLKNTIVQDGQVINAREYLRSQPKYKNIYAGSVEQRKALEKEFEEDVKKLIEEKGVLKVSQIVDNKLVIPGVEQMSQSVVNLRRNVQSLTKAALGNLSEDDVRMINMSVYGKSFMVFKNWIPRLVDVRFGNIKYNSASDAYEWGRSRMVFRVFKEELFGAIGKLRNSLVANEKGVEYMRQLYEKKRKEYMEDTGKELEMTEAQFIDLVRSNIKSQVIDLIFYVSLLILVAGIKNLPDDEEDPAVKNQYRYLVKMADKFKDEISYFYNPTALLKTVSGNVFPAISLLDNFQKGLFNFFKENWALMEGDQETVDDTYVIKYWMKTFPFTNQITGYLPMFYPDLAKDLGIKMQKNYGIR